ncbi:radical SAM protein [Aromatoleum toluclasticum]|uniref:GTP 3',8-cyclase MoaA n=1 Tax=Aromatoleum toluclasticum TaxID=92003 RepID=UPI003F694891
MLVDACGRTIDYLRLSVTDRCDLRCTYCRPADRLGCGQQAESMSFDEIERVARVFVALGVTRIRLTGGEPLARARFDELAQRIGRLSGLRDLSVSSNGAQLERFARPLRDAGVSRLNVSLDTLSRERFRALTGRDALDAVLRGLASAARCGFDLIKINMVWLPRLNAEDLEPMLEYCMNHGFVLRLIETMPVGEAARAHGSHTRCNRSSASSASATVSSITSFPAAARRATWRHPTGGFQSASSRRCRNTSATAATGSGCQPAACSISASVRRAASTCARQCGRATTPRSPERSHKPCNANPGATVSPRTAAASCVSCRIPGDEMPARGEMEPQTLTRYCSRFGELAIERGFINRYRLTKAFQRQREDVAAGRPHRSIGGILFQEGAMLLAAISEISTALHEQSATSSDIARHVESIARMSEENDQAARQAAAAAEQLKDLAGAVRHEVRRFTL